MENEPSGQTQKTRLAVVFLVEGGSFSIRQALSRVWNVIEDLGS